MPTPKVFDVCPPLYPFRYWCLPDKSGIDVADVAFETPKFIYDFDDGFPLGGFDIRFGVVFGATTDAIRDDPADPFVEDHAWGDGCEVA